MDAGDALAPVGTLLIGGPAIFAFLKWSLERNLEAFEEKIAALFKDNDALRAELKALKEARATEQTTTAVDKANAQNNTNMILQTVSSLDGQFKEMTRQNEEARNKQADFYREELKKIEFNFRQEITKQSGTDALMAVRDLEKRLLSGRTTKKR